MTDPTSTETVPDPMGKQMDLGTFLFGFMLVTAYLLILSLILDVVFS